MDHTKVHFWAESQGAFKLNVYNNSQKVKPTAPLRLQLTCVPSQSGIPCDHYCHAWLQEDWPNMCTNALQSVNDGLEGLTAGSSQVCMLPAVPLFPGSCALLCGFIMYVRYRIWQALGSSKHVRYRTCQGLGSSLCEAPCLSGLPETNGRLVSPRKVASESLGKFARLGSASCPWLSCANFLQVNTSFSCDPSGLL
jgi:hypothetical protein